MSALVPPSLADPSRPVLVPGCRASSHHFSSLARAAVPRKGGSLSLAPVISITSSTGRFRLTRDNRPHSGRRSDVLHHRGHKLLEGGGADLLHGSQELESALHQLSTANPLGRG